MAGETRRSLSDYCRYVLEQHVLAVKEEFEVKEEGAAEAKPQPKTEPDFFCSICYKSFENCDCASNGIR